MARILFTTQPMAGHLRPGLAVARELVAAGHEVAWYTGRKYRSAVTSTGARFVPYPAELDWDDTRRLSRNTRRRPGLRQLEQDMIDLFVGPIPAHVAALQPVLDEFAPDVVAAEQGFMAGAFAAQQRGIPRVVYTITTLNLDSVDTAPWGTGLPPSSSRLGRLRNRVLNWAFIHILFARAQRLADQTRQAMGLPSMAGYFMNWSYQSADAYLHTSIPELEYPRSDLPDSVEYVGALIPAGVDEWRPPLWWPEVARAKRDGVPVVLVTQGTLATQLDNLIRPTLRALATERALVIATTADMDPAEVPAPPNARVERFIPFTQLLPFTDVIVTNGGFGGVQQALAAGVPLVCAGTTEDKAEVNARVAWSGAGVNLGTDFPTEEQIRTGVRTVLADASYRTHAARLRDSYARYPGASRVAEVILDEALKIQRHGEVPQFSRESHR